MKTRLAAALPSITWSAFDLGRVRARLKAAGARADAGLAAYEQTVLKALEETENALVAYANEQERRDRVAATVRSDETAFELANVQYRAGLTDFLTVLDAQRQLYANQDLLAQSQTRVTTNVIGLYRALGGGWSISPNAQ